MNFKKKVSGSWVDVPHYIAGTDTETITTLPDTIYPLAQTATIGLRGNTAQSGTPTPDNPVMPQGTGDKTANLFIQKLTGATIDSTGKITSDANYDTYIAEVSDGETYTVSNATGIQVFGFFTTIPTLSTITYNSSRTIFSTPSQTLTVPTGENIKYIGVRYNTGVSNEMLNTGSTALPYEPYGYKIPISSADTTTNVYLGEVESTRNIARYVFTGQETWVKSSQAFYTDIIDSLAKSNTLPVCSHFNSSFSNGICVTTGNKRLKLFESALPTGVTTTAEVQQYMLAQYNNGTPVILWYVLATPTTGIVNEPIRKIGNYADEVSGITIPTIAGANSFDVLTTLKPSEVTASFNGWHPVTVAHERSGGQWD